MMNKYNAVLIHLKSDGLPTTREEFLTRYKRHTKDLKQILSQLNIEDKVECEYLKAVGAWIVRGDKQYLDELRIAIKDSDVFVLTENDVEYSPIDLLLI